MKFEDAHLPPVQGSSTLKQECEFVPENIIINEIQLLLAEKRTSLSTMRTGIAVFVLPLSVLSVLIATSKYYNVLQVVHLIVPLLVICGIMVLLGSYLIIRAMLRMRRHDSLIIRLKRKHRWIAEFVD
ncbi:MAG: hypothetical protein P8012_04990 [Desulfobacterales bacterium]